MHALKLTRYFSFLSFILVVIAGTVLGVLVHQQEIDQMTQTAQDRNVNLTKVLHTVLAEDINTLIHAPDPVKVLRLHSKIKALARNANIHKIKLYSPQGLTTFSTDLTQIGENKTANAGFQSALAGTVASELSHRLQVSNFEGVVQDVDLVSSYIPVHDNGQLIAVFEVYQDVTQLIERINTSVMRIWLIVVSVLGALYALLQMVLRHTNRLLDHKQAELQATNRELDQRVTARTQELQHSEARFRSLTAMSSDFYWETDAAHRFTLRTLSRQEAAQPVYEQLAFIGKKRWEVPSISPDADGWRAHRASLDAHEPFREFEVARLNASGQLTWFSISGDPQFNAEGKFVGYLGVGNNITQHKQADADLRLAAATFESQEATMVTDAKRVILRVNQAFTTITGYQAHEVVGKTPKLLSSGRHDAAFFRTMWETIDRTGGWQGEIWDRRKNGEDYPKWLTITAVKNPAGQITHFIGTHSDITERKKNEEKIQHLAFFDPLTQLPNRTLLMDRLKQAMAEAHRNQTFGALLFIDLDHFKNLNDTMGHDKGDLLLQQVAKRLSVCVRQGDTVARLGGDEFVVVLKNLGDNAQEAATLTQTIGEKIRAELNQTHQLDQVQHRNSASLGATVFGSNNTPLEDLLKQADLAMYRSKEQGRNLLHFFDPVMQQDVLQRSALEADLRQALSQQQFVLHYQPQVNGDGKTLGAEALVRWQHPQRGMVSPAEFIALAEDTGLILPLGLWVLDNACQQLARWADQPALASLSVAVNVSARQFRQPEFVAQVLQVLERTGARADRLKLELTESLLIENVDNVIAKMKALKSTGVGFSLDDFGTGYSSLAYLSQLPLDQLKIDRSFVMNLETDDNAVVICAATIGLAHNLKLKVVAEGVETQAQRYVLSTVHHCDLLQGYLHSRPLPVDEFVAYVGTHAK